MIKRKQACFIKTGYCGHCEGLHFELCDAKGRVFAEAIVDKAQASHIGTEVTSYIREGADARCLALQGKPLQ